MTPQSKIKNKLQDVQLRHWLRAARTGDTPTYVNPETGEVQNLSWPLSRSDGDGLTFTLSESGTASWTLRYYHGGKQRELTIGNYPDIGISDARKIAQEKRAEVDRGAHPAADKRKATVLAFLDWTVRDLVKDYRTKILVGLGKSTQISYGRSLVRIENHIGSYMVSKVAALDIVSMIENEGATWSESNMLLCTTRMLFRHAAGRKLVPANPCAGIELSALMGARPPVRRRLMLSESELKLLLHGEMKRENALAIRLLLGTAVRTDELRNATWPQFDFGRNVWSVPATKTGPGIQIPLTQQVRTWLLELKEYSRGSRYVLPGRRVVSAGDVPINPNTIGSAIEFWYTTHKPAVRRFTPHDLRSTAKSHMRALGVPRDITEMCLNHKLPGVEGIYDVHTYFEERKEALTRWCDYLQRIEDTPLSP